jgi:hypothetical protein
VAVVTVVVRGRAVVAWRWEWTPAQVVPDTRRSPKSTLMTFEPNPETSDASCKSSKGNSELAPPPKPSKGKVRNSPLPDPVQERRRSKGSLAPSCRRAPLVARSTTKLDTERPALRPLLLAEELGLDECEPELGLTRQPYDAHAPTPMYEVSVCGQDVARTSQLSPSAASALSSPFEPTSFAAQRDDSPTAPGRMDSPGAQIHTMQLDSHAYGSRHVNHGTTQSMPHPCQDMPAAVYALGCSVAEWRAAVCGDTLYTD